MELFLDTETSGLPEKFAKYTDPGFPWIVQVAFIAAENREIVQEGNYLIKADGRKVNPRAAQIHGFTEVILDNEGVPEEQVCDVLEELFEKTNLLVCHNVGFDKPLLQNLLYRNDRQVLKLNTLPTYCTMLESVNICKLPGKFNRFKWPKLQELHKFLFDEYFMDAHDALADVKATMKCYYKLTENAITQ